MNNTQAQEVLERNEEFLKITVSKFMSKCRQSNRTGVISREDLMQEVTVCFLSEVEQYGEETARTHRLSLFHSMYQAVMTAYPLSVPKRSSGFKKITEKRLIFHEWESMAYKVRTDDFTAKTIDRISIQERLESLNDSDRQIIRWRLDGLSKREIAKRKGLTDVQMCREMKRIRRQFEQGQ